MLKIGEFSKLSMLTVKTLRYYEVEGLLQPYKVDNFTGYRYYETSQLAVASNIKRLRQLDFSVEEIKSVLNGSSVKQVMLQKAQELQQKQAEISTKLSIVNYLLGEKEMKYQAVIKELPEMIVYSEERRISNFSKITDLVLQSAEECLRLNPKIQCVSPDYCYIEYLDGEYREKDILVRYSQAVTSVGVENDRIKFRQIPKTKAICIYHKGPYENLGEAYSFIMEYTEKNGFEIVGYPRESYIDGIWNKENPEEWLTEIQLPVK